MSSTGLLIYGANGFTGKLIAERAKALGVEVIVAGRSREPVERLGRQLGFPHRVFDLSEKGAIAEALRGVRAVVHCAGPFSATSRPMVDACLAARTHYMDITGEYSVLDAVLSRDAEAKAAGVVLMPAVGFDVIPTDCLARRLKDELPTATLLELAFSGGMKPSPGTAKTAVEGLHVGARVRRNGEIVTLKAPLTRTVPFGRGERFCMSIPWGDLVTAFHSTGIPNITVYMAVPRGAARMAPVLRLAGPLLRNSGVVSFLKKQVEKRAIGPTDEQRRTVKMSVWGRVEAPDGQAVEGRLEVPEGYELTVLGALASAERVLRGDVAPGATTPAKAFGADFVTTLSGVGEFRIERIRPNPT